MTGGTPAAAADDRRPAFAVVASFVLLLMLATVVAAAARPARVGDGGGVVDALRGRRLDLNRASAEELATLPGIGPALARRIVEERLAFGPFRSVEELERVPGIGPALVERVRARAHAGAP